MGAGGVAQVVEHKPREMLDAKGKARWKFSLSCFPWLAIDSV
jgi:hypothetical protein